MKLLGTLGAFLFSSIIYASPLHNIVVFGDSLSDNGNLYEIMKHQLPPSPPYFEGRFSNGPVWVEHVADSYFPNSASAHLFDYAVGGSGVSENEEDDEDDVLLTLKKQVHIYLSSHQGRADPDDLYVVWIGANNYLGLPEEIEETLDTVNTGIVNSIKKLVSNGAKHVLVFNIPDLGKTPAATEFNAAEIMSYFSTQHNKQLYESFNQLQVEHPTVEWFYFDLGTMFSDVIDNPSNYGFTNVTNTCSEFIGEESSNISFLKMVSQVRPKLTNDGCDGYLFFDLVHPTAYAHRLIAEKVREMFDGLGVEFAEG